MDVTDDDPVFAAHRGGKLTVESTMRLDNRAALSLAYTPGVAQVCLAIAEDETRARDYTWRSRLVAVVSDGTAVLGLGNIGAAASLPVMEGKCALFREFAGVNAVPIVLSTTDVDAIVETVVRIAPSFGGINLEDISAPRCFEIERRLRERLDIPVFHDDQHGTAVVLLAALRNAATVTGRQLGDLRVVVSGAGAAGVACTKMLQAAGIGDIAVADSKGIVHQGRHDLNPVKVDLAATTNAAGLNGSLADALVGADVFVGLSAGRVPEEQVAADGAGLLHLRHGQPRSGGRPGSGPPLRLGGGHRTQRLPEPDQQRAVLPGHLRRRLRRRGPGDHRGHEAGRGRRHRRRGGRRTQPRVRGADPVRRAGRSGRAHRGGRPGPGRRRRHRSWTARPDGPARRGRSGDDAGAAAGAGAADLVPHAGQAAHRRLQLGDRGGEGQAQEALERAVDTEA